MRKIGERFEFQGNIYAAKKYYGFGGDSNHCEECDLKVNGRKLCLNNECPCEECGHDSPNGKALVFKNVVNTLKIPNKDAEKWKAILVENMRLRNRVISLEGQVETFKEQIETFEKQKTDLIHENMVLREKKTALENQMKHIYANITTAIKKEVYKNFS